MAKRKLKKKVRLNSLKATHQPRVRAELIDYDYLKKLNPEDLRWLAQFTDESVGASIEKDKNGKVKPGYIHTKPEHVKECYDANNRRNNDVYGVSRANNMTYDIDSKLNQSDGWYITNPNYTEDSLISELDNRNEIEELELIEYFEARDQFVKERQIELDSEFIKRTTLNSDQFYMLVIIYNFKIESNRKIINMSKSTTLLEKFIKNSELFKTKDDSSNDT